MFRKVHSYLTSKLNPVPHALVIGRHQSKLSLSHSCYPHAPDFGTVSRVCFAGKCSHAAAEEEGDADYVELEMLHA